MQFDPDTLMYAWYQYTAFNVGIQGNVGIRGFRVGVAYMLREPCDGCNLLPWHEGRNNFRVLLGADIISFFTGTSTAVVSGSSGSGPIEN